jgi:RNA polymerase sigma factor (sigma-70 family)
VNDPEVIQKILEGDREVFTVLVNRYKDMAFTIAFRMVNNRTDAEEIVQEAFIRAYDKLGHFRQDAAFSTWFYRIVYNGSVSFLRSRKNWVGDDSEFVLQNVSEEQDIFDSETTNLRKDAVLWVLARLKPVDRAIVTLFYHENKSLKEIGVIIDMQEDTVKMRLFRARRSMKKLLETKFKGVFAEVLL